MKTLLYKADFNDFYTKKKRYQIFTVDENGIKNGIYKCWTEDGILIISRYFLDGVPHGFYERFSVDGVREEISNYNNWDYQGVVIYFK